MATPNTDGIVHIYTDGGCDPNPGVGGWAAVLIHGERSKELSGGALDTTNNRMEMTAAIEALKALKRSCKVRLHTDSEYLKRGITEWMPKWKRLNWTRGRNPVKNLDLWQELDRLNSSHEIAWEWVRGHAGNYYNERCDELAGLAIRKLKGKGH
jgi:ribonuclease HI